MPLYDRGRQKFAPGAGVLGAEVLRCWGAGAGAAVSCGAMALSSGTRIGPYEVVSPLGAGGMGEVYRAHDQSTGRDVALKVLPELAAVDPDRLARFQREAKALGGLNHPNIAAIYGVEDRGAVPAIIMELVAGDDLSQRIERGPVPVPEALTIARQIADALSAAHDAGVVHRDLKPHNIKVRDDGVVKVLDFGLAKTTDAVSSSTATNSPTLTARATAMGMILGTAAYMAPEQAKGKPVDKRADIWAFGVVLYEMLTGRRAFPGEDVSDVLASVLKTDPDFQALPPETPPAVRRLIGRCLTKDPRERLRDLGEGMRQLDDAEGAPAVSAHSAVPRQPFWRRAMPVAIAVIVTAAAAYGASRLLAPAPPPPAGAVRFLVPSMPGATILQTAGHSDIALLPDGSGFVYSVIGQAQASLQLRRFAEFESTAVRGAVGAVGPFISPDAQWVGFSDSANPARLKKVQLSGGTPATLALFPHTVYGATWTQDGRSIVAGSASGGLHLVDHNGGQPTEITSVDPKTGDNSHRWPTAVPGTNIVLFVGFGPSGAHLSAIDLGTRQVVRLGVQGSTPRYLAPGYIVFGVRDGGLRAVQFDPARMEVRGTPAPVLEGITAKGSGAVMFDMLPAGQLVYGLGGGMLSGRRIVWVDRTGKETLTNAPERTYFYARFAPKGEKLSLDVREQDGDIWLWDPRGTMQRLTQTDGSDQYGLWTPAGDRVIFQSDMSQKTGLYVMRADGIGQPSLVLEGPAAYPNAVTPDGLSLIYRQATPQSKNDLMLISIDGPDRTPKGLIQSPYDELNAAISPDGKWIVFESDASGRAEVYVRPFPDVNAFQEVVSTAGGTEPVWGPGSREIVFLGADGKLKLVTMAVGAAGKPTFTAPSDLFDTAAYFFGGVGRNYDISPDGRRFVMVKRSGDAPSSTEPLRVVLNWAEDVRRAVGR